jgi:cardiolipin synthase
MDSAKKELAMTVFVISDTEILSAIERALNRGVFVQIFMYDNPETDKFFFDHLLGLRENYKHAGIYVIKGNVLHAKVLVSDARRVLIGSANPTFSGMVKNYEMGLIVEDSSVAQKVLTLLWRLA